MTHTPKVIIEKWRGEDFYEQYLRCGLVLDRLAILKKWADYFEGISFMFSGANQSLNYL
jgi:hypothetical protein